MNNQVYAHANHNYMLNDTDNKKHHLKRSSNTIYSIAHLIIGIFAIYLSWRCNKGFDLLSFLMALCCPYLYIIYILATNGGCGIFDNINKISVDK